MGRLGVQKEEVFQAAGELERRGVTVTVANIRQELGTGSYSTLLPLINDYQTAKRAHAQQSTPLPALPGEILEASARFAQGLWDMAARLADARIKEIEMVARERESEFDKLMQSKEEELSQAHKDIQSIETQLEDVTKKYEIANQKSLVLEGEKQALLGQLKEKESENRQLIERAAKAEHEAQLSRKR